jgi:hypothetical protein
LIPNLKGGLTIFHSDSDAISSWRISQLHAFITNITS